MYVLQIYTDGIMSPLARLEIRIDEDTKKRLEKLARILETTVSDIVREYAIKIALITKYIDIVDVMDATEEKIVKALLNSVPFQELFKKLIKHVDACSKVYHGTKHVYRALIGTKCLDWGIWIDERTALYKLKKITWEEDINFEEVRTLKDLRNFLNEMEQEFGNLYEQKINELKELLGLNSQ